MKRHHVCGGLIAGLVLAAGVGCASRSSSNLPVYERSQTGTPISVQKGRVIAVRDVLIKAPTSRPGSIGSGAQIGSGAVASVITGSPAAIGAAVGQVVGGKVGGQLDDRMGEEITLETDDGIRMIIVQERLETPLSPGEAIEIHTIRPTPGRAIYGGVLGGNTRVIRAVQFQSERPTFAASERSAALE